MIAHFARRGGTNGNMPHATMPPAGRPPAARGRHPTARHPGAAARPAPARGRATANAEPERNPTRPRTGPGTAAPEAERGGRSPEPDELLVLFDSWGYFGNLFSGISMEQPIWISRKRQDNRPKDATPTIAQPQPQPCKLHACLAPSDRRIVHSLPYGSAPLTPHVSPPHASAVDEFRCLACMPGPHDILPMHTLRQIKLARGRRKS